MSLLHRILMPMYCAQLVGLREEKMGPSVHELTASLTKTSDVCPFHFGSLSGNSCPISGCESAPKIASANKGLHSQKLILSGGTIRFAQSILREKTRADHTCDCVKESVTCHAARHSLSRNEPIA